ncbi:Mbov_0400 family ICE element protein [Mycoplasma sp. 1012]
MKKDKNHIDTMKPFFPEESITFDRLEDDFHKHPVIIFYNEWEEIYYYLKCRSSIKHKNFRHELNGEYLIKKANNGLLNHDSFIDTAQIYKIFEKDLFKVFDKNNLLYLDTKFLDLDDIKNIYFMLWDNLKQNPPYVSLSEISIKNDQITAKTLYCHKDFLTRDLNHFKNSNNSEESILEKEKLVVDIINNRNTLKQTLLELKNIYLGTNSEYKELMEEIDYFEQHKSSIINNHKSFIETNGFNCHHYCASQLKQIFLGLESKIDVSKYATNNFNCFQMEQIRLGLEKNLDISLYANPIYDNWQMKEIREGLLSNIDVLKYADPKNSSEEMKNIRLILQKNKNQH